MSVGPDPDTRSGEDLLRLGAGIVAAYVIVGGIATLTLLFSQLSGYLQTVKPSLSRSRETA